MTVEPALWEWMLDSDPALRWQVERDLTDAPPEVWQATRARIATEGFGAQLLALQDPDGQWAGGAFFPKGFDFEGPEAAPGAGQPWTATTWSLKALRDWGLDASALAGTAEKIDANSRWEYDDLPYWHGEVDCCINSFTLASGAWLGADVSGIAQWFVDHRLPDGGWNCEWELGSTRSSFHSTLNSIEGLLYYETVMGGSGARQQAGGSGRSPIGGARQQAGGSGRSPIGGARQQAGGSGRSPIGGARQQAGGLGRSPIGDELRAARRSGEEYLLQRRLLYRLSTGELVAPRATHFAYPFRSFYSALHAVDYFRAASLHDGTAPDPRLRDAIDVIRGARQPDGTWLQERRHRGRVWFEVDVPAGEPSKWLTFHATRALEWWDAATGA